MTGRRRNAPPLLRLTGAICAIAALASCARLPDIVAYETGVTRIERSSTEVPAFAKAPKPSTGALAEDAAKAGFTSALHLRNDRLLTEWYGPNRNATDAANIKSVSKTLLAMLVGALAADGVIDPDTPIPRFGDCETPPALAPLTARTLLTMGAGFAYRENISTGVFRGDDWLCETLALPVEAPSGTRFNYTTLQSFLLAAHLEDLTGRRYHEMLETRLLSPLGITLNGWLTSPKGRNLGGSDLRLTPRDMLRLGQLIQAGGQWDGRQLVPRNWITAMARPAFDQIGRPGFSYGTGLWLTHISDHEALWAEGYGGQLVIVLPDLAEIFVFTAPTGGTVSSRTHAARMHTAKTLVAQAIAK